MIIKFCSKTVIICLEVLLVLIVLLGIAGGFVFWRFSQGPLDVSFAKSTLEETISAQDERFSVTMEGVVFNWPKFSGPLFLDIDGLTLYEQNQEKVLSIDEAAIGLSKPHLLIGRISPESVIIKNPTIRLVRQGNNIDLIFQDQQIGQEKTETEPVNLQMREALNQLLQADSKNFPLLGAFKIFEIEDARMVVQDYTAGISWFLTDIDFRGEREEDLLKSSVKIQLPVGQDQEHNLIADFVYQKGRNSMLDLTFSHFDPRILTKFLTDYPWLQDQDFIVDAAANIVLDENLLPLNADIKVRGTESGLFFPEEYDDPLIVEDLIVDLKLDVENQMADFEALSFAFNKIPVEMPARVTWEEDKISAPLHITFGDFEPEILRTLFPKSMAGEPAEEWLAQKIYGGLYKDVVLKTDASFARDEEGEWKPDAENLRLDFAFEGVTVNYREPLMPVTQASGKGYFENNNLVIDGEKGMVGDMRGQNVKLLFTDFTKEGAGLADIKINAVGPFSTVLKYISDEPIALGDKLGLDPETVKGDANLDVQLNFPTIKELQAEQVQVKVAGTVSDVYLPDMVQGLALSGGPLTLKAADGAFDVQGAAKLDGRPVQLSWKQFIEPEGKPYEMKVKASMTADQELRHHFGVFLDEYITGPLPVDVVFTRDIEDQAVLDIKGNLEPMALTIEPFQYIKPSGIGGSVTMKALLDDDVLKEIKDLKLQTRDFKLDNGRLIFSRTPGSRDLKDVELSRGKLTGLNIGHTDLNADFEVTPQNILKIIAEGDVFDARVFAEQSPDQSVPNEDDMAMQISLKSDWLYTKADRQVGDAQIYLEIDRMGEVQRMEMDAKTGSGDIYIRFKPDSTGKRTLRFEADDAGAALKAFDLYDDAEGGTITVYGEPRGRDLYGDLYGVARMENFKVVEAPGLARLISSMSLTGVQEVLSNDGINFSKLEAGFEWDIRPGGSLVTVKDGRTSGSALGLTIDGTIDRKAETVDFKGTIIPISGINSFLRDIPLIGEILTGGSGLIAATYTIKGPDQDPKVSINPLSVLTPGFLRTILFEGGFEQPIPQEEEDRQ